MNISARENMLKEDKYTGEYNKKFMINLCKNRKLPQNKPTKKS